MRVRVKAGQGEGEGEGSNPDLALPLTCITSMAACSMPTRSTLLRGRPKESAWTIDGGVMLLPLLLLLLLPLLLLLLVVVGVAAVS